MSGADLSSIDEATAWVMFDTSTASTMVMSPLDAIDQEIADLILTPGAVQDLVLVAIESAYISKGYTKK